MEILSQFLLRLAFGLAVGMAITSPRQVSNGFFRNHLYVTLGLTTLAALVLAQMLIPAACFAALAALLSIAGSTSWLYDARRLGLILVWAVAWCAFLAALMGMMIVHESYLVRDLGGETSDFVLVSLRPLDLFHTVSLLMSGLVLGLTFTAMLLGHWYLNSPGMQLAPLRRLLAAAAIAVSVQALISGVGLAAELSAGAQVSANWLVFIVLRWSFGVLGVLALLWMAWRTLEIPNTQSATGILYVAVIGVFVGELAAALLSAESAFPL